MVVIVSKKKLPKASFEEEKKLWQDGVEYIIGVDEVGRGAFAGPIVAAAVVFRKASKFENLEINDSKLLKPQKRKLLCSIIEKNSTAFAVAIVDVPLINKRGIGKCNQIVIRKAISSVIKILRYKDIMNDSINYPISKYSDIVVLIDGFRVKYIKDIGLKKQKTIIKGDQKSISIAAASILAKVHRDKIMKQLAKKYKNYYFGRNKGYGTKKHQEAIKNYGLTPVHRTSFNLQKFT